MSELDPGAGYFTDRAHDDFRSVGKFVNASVSHSALGRYVLQIKP